jgi:hypothetical protein
MVPNRHDTGDLLRQLPAKEQVTAEYRRAKRASDGMEAAGMDAQTFQNTEVCDYGATDRNRASQALQDPAFRQFPILPAK